MSTPAGMNQQAGPVSWTVTSQGESTEIQSNGQAVRGYRVYFTTGTGQSGSVWIPESSYTPERAKLLVGAAAANADAIGNLSSG